MSHTHDKLIGPVPLRIIDTAQFIVTPYEGRVAEFNIAAWLQIPDLANLPVSLLATYRDGNKRLEIAVDHGKVGGTGRILLSGVARLPSKSRIEDMQIHLRSAVAATTLVVEELFVQAVEQAKPQSRQVRA